MNKKVWEHIFLFQVYKDLFKWLQKKKKVLDIEEFSYDNIVNF